MLEIQLVQVRHALIRCPVCAGEPVPDLPPLAEPQPVADVTPIAAVAKEWLPYRDDEDR